jgi:hypothetical protein
VSWVLCITEVFKTQCKQAVNHPIQSCFLQLAVSGPSSFFSLSPVVLMSFYLYPTFVALLSALGLRSF